MKLRAPSIPLITVDPYFSVWAPHEKLNFRTTRHWTGAENPIFAEAIVDGERASFLGYERESAKMTETELAAKIFLEMTENGITEEEQRSEITRLLDGASLAI